MHVFLYEWATGGGLVDHLGSLPESLVVEGAAMLHALATDFARIPGCQVTCLRDMRVLELNLPQCELIDIQSSESHHTEFKRLASLSDRTIVIAPEFDGILLKAARRVLQSGGRLLSPDPAFAKLTADKQRTAEALARTGVSVPKARVLEPDEPLPTDFTYPAVLKPIDGAGSQDTQFLVGPYDAALPYAWPRRLEAFCDGLPASVAFLCGPKQNVPLIPCSQKLSTDGRLRYLGGELPLREGLAERAQALAGRALAALPTTTGYVGVDLVLGHSPDGCEDVVIEVNPRLTTSYVGLRAAVKGNLAQAMWAIAEDQDCELAFDTRRLEFDCHGNVNYTPH
jgi:hypothetical protein